MRNETNRAEFLSLARERLHYRCPTVALSFARCVSLVMKLNANRQVVPPAVVGKWLFISPLARGTSNYTRDAYARCFVTIADAASQFETISCHARELPRSEKRQELERRPKALVLSAARVRAVIVLWVSCNAILSF